MSLLIAERELFHACQILFGFDLDISREFLEYLQPAGIKSAYRKRARETHPDLAASSDALTLRRHTELFNRVQDAYQKLSHYLEARERGFRFTSLPQRRRPARPHNPRASSATAQRSTQDFRGFNHRTQKSFYQTEASRNHRPTKIFKQYRGAIPDRPLLFGHYLYYSGVTSWRAIIQALVWQRSQRPTIGEIGQRFGWLDASDVQTVLRHRTIFKPFGVCAVDLGLLTESQVKILLFRQRFLQKKIGEFFVEKRIITPHQLGILIQKHQQHNRRITAAGVASFTFRSGI